MAMSKVVIRRATGDDVESLIDLYGDMEEHIMKTISDPLFTLGRNWRELTRRYFVEFIKGDDKLALVGQDRNKIVALLTAMTTTPIPIYVEKEYGSLNDMFVKKAYRRKGVGTKLLKAAIEWFQQKHIARIELRVEAKNKEAIAFYKKHSFKIRAHTMKKEC